MAVRTAYAGAAVSGEVLTAANVNKLPGGWIGYAEATASQTLINTEIDITGLSVSVTVGTSRRIRISYVGSFQPTFAGDYGAASIKEGATLLQGSGVISMPSTSYAFPVAASVVLTPTAGAHTYKITANRVAGSGTITHNAAATSPAFIIVEDIGSAT